MLSLTKLEMKEKLKNARKWSPKNRKSIMMLMRTAMKTTTKNKSATKKKNKISKTLKRSVLRTNNNKLT